MVGGYCVCGGCGTGLFQDYGFEPVFQDAFVARLGVGDQDEDSAAIRQDGAETHAFVVGEGDVEGAGASAGAGLAISRAERSIFNMS